jgi:hypothetical protein
MTKRKKLFWFTILGIIPYILGRIINFFFGLLPFPEDKVINLIIDHFMFFYLGALPVIMILVIISKVKHHYKIK